jgi:tRNA pseudouridine38-40 synthase
LDRLKGIVAYRGTAYKGFQRQVDERTIQGELEEAIRGVCGENTTVIGAGRTDAGVHAVGQVIAFDTASSAEPDHLARSLNGVLPEDIRLRSLRETHSRFHPGKDARSKTYRYLMRRTDRELLFSRDAYLEVEPGLDVERMRSTAGLFVGEHDFFNFSARGSVEGPTVRKVERIDIFEDGPFVVVDVAGPGFLYKMVRFLISALLGEARDEVRLTELERLLKSSREEKRMDPAKAGGLYLLKVEYE